MQLLRLCDHLSQTSVLLKVQEAPQRRLEDLQFDVIAEGQDTTFDLQWAKGVVGTAAIEAFSLTVLLSSAL